MSNTFLDVKIKRFTSSLELSSFTILEHIVSVDSEWVHLPDGQETVDLGESCRDVGVGVGVVTVTRWKIRP